MRNRSRAFAVLPMLLAVSCFAGEQKDDAELLDVEKFRAASLPEKVQIISRLCEFASAKRPPVNYLANEKDPAAKRANNPKVDDERTRIAAQKIPWPPGKEWQPLLAELSKDTVPLEVTLGAFPLFKRIGQWSPECQAFCAKIKTSKDPNLMREQGSILDIMMEVEPMTPEVLAETLAFAFTSKSLDRSLLVKRHKNTPGFKEEILKWTSDAHESKSRLSAVFMLLKLDLTREEFCTAVRTFCQCPDDDPIESETNRQRYSHFFRACQPLYIQFPGTIDDEEIQIISKRVDVGFLFDRAPAIEFVLTCAKQVPPSFLIRAAKAVQEPKPCQESKTLAGFGFLPHERNEETIAVARALIPMAKDFWQEGQTGIYSYCRRILGEEPSGFNLYPYYAPEIPQDPPLKAEALPGLWEKAVKTNDRKLKSRVLSCLYLAADTNEAREIARQIMADPEQKMKFVDELVKHRNLYTSWMDVPELKEWLSKVAEETSGQTEIGIDLWPRLSISSAVVLHTIYGDKSGMETVIKNIRESKVAYIPKMLEQWTFLTNFLLELDPKHEVLAANLAAWTKAPPDSKEAWWGWILAKCLSSEPNKPTIAALAKALKGSYPLWRQVLTFERFGGDLETFRHPVALFANYEWPNLLRFLGQMDRLYLESRAKKKEEEK